MRSGELRHPASPDGEFQDLEQPKEQQKGLSAEGQDSVRRV